MFEKIINGSVILLAICANVNPVWAAASTESSEVSHGALNIGNDDEAFVFMGRCPNGEVYRLFAYDKNIDGNMKSFYDYQGPAGKGTVKTQTVPKVMKSRVCISLAEIADDE